MSEMKLVRPLRLSFAIVPSCEAVGGMNVTRRAKGGEEEERRRG
jgi:hypothetical protein